MRHSPLNAALCLLVFQWLKNPSFSVLCSLFLWQFVRAASANPHCRPKFVNFSARKTCQCSRVASFSGRGGWFRISLALSRL